MDKSLILLDLISDDSSMSQREIARRMDVSLGTVNNMISELEDAKFITVKKVSSRKVFYQLTKKGKDYHNALYVDHVSSCFDTVASVRVNFRNNIFQLVESGKENFYIYGDTNELVRLAKMCFIEVSRKHRVQYFLISEMDDFEQSIDGIPDHEQGRHIVVGWTTTCGMDHGTLSYKNLLT